MPLYIMLSVSWFFPAIIWQAILSDFDTVTTKPKLVTIQGGKSGR